MNKYYRGYNYFHPKPSFVKPVLFILFVVGLYLLASTADFHCW